MPTFFLCHDACLSDILVRWVSFQRACRRSAACEPEDLRARESARHALQQNDVVLHAPTTGTQKFYPRKGLKGLSISVEKLRESKAMLAPNDPTLG